jgi:hypothetical protein
VTIEDVLYEKALEVADPAIDRAGRLREAIKTFERVQGAKASNSTMCLFTAKSGYPTFYPSFKDHWLISRASSIWNSK